MAQFRNLKNLFSQFLHRGSNARNSLWTLAEYGLFMLSWFAITPILVRGLGMEKFGIWAFLQTLLGSATLLRLGFSDACIKYVAQYQAAGAHDDAREIVRATWVANITLGLVAAGVAFGMIPVVLHFFFQGADASTTDVHQAMLILPAILFLRFLDDALTAMLQAGHRFELNSQINLPMNLTCVAIMSLLASGGKLTALVEVMLGTSLIIVITKAFAVRRAMSFSLRPDPRGVLPSLRRMTSFGAVTWGHQLMGFLCDNLDRFIIARMLGPIGMGFYSLSYQLASQGHLVPSRMSSFLFPKTAALHAVGDTTRLRHAFLRSQAILTAVAAGICLPLFVLAHPLLQIWAGPAAATGSTHFLQLLAIAFTLAATSVAPFYFLKGTGFVRLNAVFGTISSIVLIALVLLLVPRFGLEGAGWARIATHAIALILFPILFRKMFYENAPFAGLLMTLPAALPFAIAALFRLPEAQITWPILIIAVAGLGGLGMLTSLLCSYLCQLFLRPHDPAPDHSPRPS